MGKLIKKGFRVAVCEQVENPKDAKGLVKREVTQVVSPGTVTDQNLLDPATSNYLVSLYRFDEKGKTKQAKSKRGKSSASDSRFGIAWADSSTGRFCVTVVPAAQVVDLLARLNASEILVPTSSAGNWSSTLRVPTRW